MLPSVQALWEPSGTYLNTASFGLPPRPAWNALQAALDDWRTGRTSWEPWGEATEAARDSFARLIGVDPSTVAVGANVSGLVGLVAASLPAGSRILTPEVEFTSILFPFLVQAHRGLTVRMVPAAELADAIDDTTDVVAFSAVQMATGEVADLEAIAGAARAHGALTLVDATQACGWLPLDCSLLDIVVAAGYKWLLSPRGTAYMAVAPGRLEAIVPMTAGWYAGDDVHASYFGPPLRLATDARRLDTSPAWHSWVGAAAAMAVIEEIGVDAIHEHNLRLANRFRVGLGLDSSNSAIVFVDAADAEEQLEQAGIRAAIRNGRLRTSWHVYNTEADVERTLQTLGV
ncbi:MAG: aminotransferase class V-fold PLP-dependent enzyme [Thermoleophilia bacterium]|nr:aminotransferase class V-fold PLP-dependent enzyme [Thermoleophilia bacterium]